MNEFRERSIDTDPVPGLGEAQRALREFFQQNVAFHYAFLHQIPEIPEVPGVTALTYGRLRRSKRIAVKTKGKPIAAEKKPTSVTESSDREWTEGEVIHLNVGEQYHPWGEGGRVFTHGVDDNTHANRNRKKRLE